MNRLQLVLSTNKLLRQTHLLSPALLSCKNDPQNLNSSNFHNPHSLNFQKRDFSLKETVESFARTQSGIFKGISESTPVEYLQNFLVQLHDTTGLPWWATIMTTTVLLRSSVTLPLAVYQNYIVAKIQNLHLEMPDIVTELKKETAVAVRMYNWDEKTTKYHYKRSLKKQWNALIVRDNCHPFKATLLFWIQIPMWVCFSVSLRNLVYMLPKGDLDAKLTFTEMTIGGFGWIPNLIEVDSSLILPVALGVINLAIIELQALSKVTVPSKFQRYFTHFFRAFSLLMVPIAACVPSCLSLYWVTSSTYGLIQNLLIMSPRFKRFCRIPQTVAELERPYYHVAEGIKFKLKSIPGFSKSS